MEAIVIPQRPFNVNLLWLLLVSNKKMQRNLVVFATACICLVAATVPPDVMTADKTFLTRQKVLYSLFWHTDQPTTVNSDLYQVARSWSIEDHVGSFANEVNNNSTNFLKIFQ